MEERNKELLKDALGKAEKGEPYACCLLGQMFKESICHAKEKYEYPISGCRQLTKIYYELAANQGYANGMYYLGNECFEDGELEQAEKWLIKAAEEGIKDPEEKRKLLAEMKEYNLKALGLSGCPKSVLEELVSEGLGKRRDFNS